MTTTSPDGVIYKYYVGTFYRNASRNRPVRVTLNRDGAPLVVERIHPLTGELEVMEGYLQRWGKDFILSEQEIDLARFEALRERMLAPPSDDMTYEYFLYAATLVRILIDSQGNRRGTEYMDRRTGAFVKDATYLSKIAFDWNAEAEEIDQADFERLHEQIKQAVKQK